MSVWEYMFRNTAHTLCSGLQTHRAGASGAPYPKGTVTTDQPQHSFPVPPSPRPGLRALTSASLEGSSKAGVCGGCV